MLRKSVFGAFFASTFFAPLISVIQPTAACNGYEIKNTKMEWCSDEKESPVGFENLKLVLDEKCILKFGEGSKIIYKKKINKMAIEYALNTYDSQYIDLEGDVEDFCEELKNVESSKEKDIIYDLMSMFGIAKNCPIDEHIVENGESSAFESSTKSTFKTIFYGRTGLNFTLDTDAGFACLLTEIEIGKIGE